MLNIDWITNGSKKYDKGTDDEGNIYYYSLEKKLYLCFTPSGSIGAGRTTKEALEYAISNGLKAKMEEIAV